MGHSKDDNYSEAETQRRAEAALRAAFKTPAKPQSEMKLGKRKLGKRQARKPQRMAQKHKRPE
jgi:hypothetical protein